MLQPIPTGSNLVPDTASAVKEGLANINDSTISSSQSEFSLSKELAPFATEALNTTEASSASESSAPPPPARAARDEEIRKELESSVFNVKKVSWFDPYGRVRESPIILQNKNGPCPLIALVNTLILSTAPGSVTPISNISAARTEINASYLIDLLADVLLSSNNTEHTDVNHVLSLLHSLHTGLNINPRFDGSFEASEELAVFRAFDVDLVHGWVSDPSNKYVDSAVTKAESYEGAQGLLVALSELSSKLENGQSLTEEELDTMENARLVQLFLSQTATQLTPFGLSFLSELLSPGSLAVLFRNDHFSTIYKHPDSKQLFMLATDSGFSSMPNIVWQSLSDVSGSSSCFFNGVFVPSEFGEETPKSAAAPPQHPTQNSSPVPTTDLDLALAMELQREEDENLAREEQRRENRAVRNARRGETRSQTVANSVRSDMRPGSSAAAPPAAPGSRPRPGTRGSHGNDRPRGPTKVSIYSPYGGQARGLLNELQSAGPTGSVSATSKSKRGGSEKDKCCIM